MKKPLALALMLSTASLSFANNDLQVAMEAADCAPATPSASLTGRAAELAEQIKASQELRVVKGSMEKLRQRIAEVSRQLEDRFPTQQLNTIEESLAQSGLSETEQATVRSYVEEMRALRANGGHIDSLDRSLQRVRELSQQTQEIYTTQLGRQAAQKGEGVFQLINELGQFTDSVESGSGLLKKYETLMRFDAKKTAEFSMLNGRNIEQLKEFEEATMKELIKVTPREHKAAVARELAGQARIAQLEEALKASEEQLSAAKNQLSIAGDVADESDLLTRRQLIESALEKDELIRRLGEAQQDSIRRLAELNHNATQLIEQADLQKSILSRELSHRGCQVDQLTKELESVRRSRNLFRGITGLGLGVGGFFMAYQMEEYYQAYNGNRNARPVIQVRVNGDTTLGQHSRDINGAELTNKAFEAVEGAVEEAKQTISR